jgi:predicted enzyme related to lactoylglutathione lyase
MKVLSRIMIAAAAMLATAGAQSADVTLDSVRIGAKDVLATAKFYQTAFGMFEVNRISQPNMLEVMLTWGANAEAAKTNPVSQIVIMSRAADDGSDKMAHLILRVKDMQAAVKAAVAAGAKAERPPFKFDDMWIGMLIDPAGNHIELLQYPPAHPLAKY